MPAIEDALKGLTRRQLEELRTKLDKELQECTICHSEGAEKYNVVGFGHQRGNIKAAMLFCKPCFEKYRQPFSRGQEKT